MIKSILDLDLEAPEKARKIINSADDQFEQLEFEETDE